MIGARTNHTHNKVQYNMDLSWYMYTQNPLIQMIIVILKLQ